MRATILTAISDNLDDPSKSRLLRAFQRHNAATKSPSPESQLLELWSAIEVLFPTYKNSQDRIVQIIDSVVPYVTKEYPAKLSADLVKSINNSGSTEAIKIVESMNGRNQIEKCLSLICIKDNATHKADLLEKLENHVLLKNRIEYLSGRFSSAKAILQTRRAHSQRVSWQIQRIYRTRNFIIHSGESVHVINTLVENLHTYLDRVMDVLIEEIERKKVKTSIDEIHFDIRLESRTHQKVLKKHKDEFCTSDNLRLLLFGNPYPE